MHLKTTPDGAGSLRAAKNEARYGDYRCKDGKWKRKPRLNEIACAFAMTGLCLAAGAYAWLSRGEISAAIGGWNTLPSAQDSDCVQVATSTWSCATPEVRAAAAKVEKWYRPGDKAAAAQKAVQAAAPKHVVLGYDIRSYATDPKHEAKVAAIVARMPGMDTAAQAEKYIRSRFKASPVTGEMAYAAAKKHGVPLKLVVAIMEQDSSMGTAGKGARTKNPGNVGNDDRGRLVAYRTWSSGVEAVAKWLSKHKAPEAVALGD
jgi:hypothetical protein